MPAACDGNPCHNGGICTRNNLANDIQFCFTIHIEMFDNFKRYIVAKHVKAFKCTCKNGFTGDFCEYLTEQDHLLFLGASDFYFNLVFNVDGRLIAQNDTEITGDAGVIGACSTMLNGEVVVFGGDYEFSRQVHPKYSNKLAGSFI